MRWTDEQIKRLEDLTAPSEVFEAEFTSATERNQAFQQIEKKISRETAENIRHHLK